MDGLLIVDKPSGLTSHDVVARARRALREPRIGHTGTLDPMATGVLLLVVGKATRLAKFLSGSGKSYDATIRFGFATDTADAHGRPLTEAATQPMPSREAIEKALDAYRGTFMQQPPAFSAKKIDGQRSYRLARAAAAKRGRESIADPATADPVDPVDIGSQKTQSTPDPENEKLPAPCSVTTTRLEIVAVAADTVTLTVDCSAGFYVRSLAHDLGVQLGVGAHLSALRRTRVGDFTLDLALELEALQRDPQQAAAAMVPLTRMLPALPCVRLTPEGVNRVRHGRDVGTHDVVHDSPEDSQPALVTLQLEDDYVRLLGQQGELLAIARHDGPTGALHPSVVLV